MATLVIEQRHILLKQTVGEKLSTDGGKPFSMWIAKGDLVTEIPEKDQVPRDKGHPHNYRKLTEPDVTFYNDGTDIAPLDGREADYLLGVEEACDRMHEYLKPNKLKEVTDLRTNDVVLFKLDCGGVDKVIRGKVKYYGAYPGSKGVKFGIEIMVCYIQHVHVHYLYPRPHGQGVQYSVYLLTPNLPLRSFISKSEQAATLRLGHL